jgi:hypothetical protein
LKSIEDTNRNLRLIDHINANQKLIPVGDEIIENVFKDVEEQIMSLAKVLSGLYFQSLPPSQSSNNLNNTGNNNANNYTTQLSQSSGSGNFLGLPFQPHHSQQASGSVNSYIFFLII